MKYFVIGVIVVVGAAIVYGFIIAGSPQEERLRKFDDQRAQDLQLIQNQIVNFWQAKNVLPAALADLRDSLSGMIIPVDPETKQAYEYTVVNPTTFAFELCAVFNRASDSVSPSVTYPSMLPGGDNWQHGAGRVCFERTIDKELYGKRPPYLAPQTVPSVAPAPAK